MNDGDRLPTLSPELVELLVEASAYLATRSPGAQLGRQLLERNSPELLGAYVLAERELDALRKEVGRRCP